jgi:hypothetical protein
VSLREGRSARGGEEDDRRFEVAEGDADALEHRWQVSLRVVIRDLGDEELSFDGIVAMTFLTRFPEDRPDQNVGIQDETACRPS